MNEQTLPKRPMNAAQLLLGLLIGGVLPFLFIIFSFLPGQSTRIGAGLVIFTIIIVGYLWYFRPKKYIWALLLVIPMYGFACLGFVDDAFFTAGSATAKYEAKLEPGGEFMLGTDYEGRDILSTIVIGGKHAYLVALFTCLTALITGVPLGLLLTLRSKLISAPANWITQFFEIVPQLFFVLIVMGVYNFWAAQDAVNRLQSTYSLPIAGLAIGLSALPTIARIVEHRVKQLQKDRFVLALQSSNVKPSKILLYNIVWKNSIPEILVQTTFLFGSALLLESALTFAYEIGFGDLGSGGYLSWGKLLAEARSSILFGENLWIVMTPIVVTLISILGVNLLGDTMAKHIREVQ